MEIEPASVRVKTIEDAVAHCQTQDMELFSPTNRGQTDMMLEFFGIPGECLFIKIF